MQSFSYLLFNVEECDSDLLLFSAFKLHMNCFRSCESLTAPNVETRLQIGMACRIDNRIRNSSCEAQIKTILRDKHKGTGLLGARASDNLSIYRFPDKSLKYWFKPHKTDRKPPPHELGGYLLSRMEAPMGSDLVSTIQVLGVVETFRNVFTVLGVVKQVF